MKEIGINDYYEPEHFRALCEDNYNISRTMEIVGDTMNHIHNSCEILFVEEGVAEYTVFDRKYLIEKYDILVIGAMEYHHRVIVTPPYKRYGLAVNPKFIKDILNDDDLVNVYKTPIKEDFVEHYKNIDKDIFQGIVELLKILNNEADSSEPFKSLLEKSIFTQITVMLFREFNIKKLEGEYSVQRERMNSIKEYIDNNYFEDISLEDLSQKFYLHPTTISKEFNKYCGKNIKKYIIAVKIYNATKLLENTNYSILTVSEKSGFNNVNTFLRQFKSVMEISPLQYRKSLTNLFNSEKIKQ